MSKSSEKPRPLPEKHVKNQWTLRFISKPPTNRVWNWHKGFSVLVSCVKPCRAGLRSRSVLEKDAIEVLKGFQEV